MAELLARDLAVRRCSIISGMARGIDSCAHQGALAARMPTVAVWGTGIDVVYPKENKKLAEEILAAGGAIVSELPMGTFPAPQNFPRRNRILSGLSVAVLVVEAARTPAPALPPAAPPTRIATSSPFPATSPTRAPGPPTRSSSKAQSWSPPGRTCGRICPRRCGWNSRARPRRSPNPTATASLLPDPVLRPEEAMVLEVLRADASLQIDEILELLETQLTSSEVFTALFELEITGRVR